MYDKKTRQTHLDAVLSRAVPSQLPFNVTRESYRKMLSHCKTEGLIWACDKAGARVKARVVRMNVFDRKSNTLKDVGIPVATLYCSACDAIPTVQSQDTIFADQIQTVSM